MRQKHDTEVMPQKMHLHVLDEGLPSSLFTHTCLTIMCAKFHSFTHDGPAPGLALRAGQAAPRVPRAGGAGGVGETHDMEEAAERDNQTRRSIKMQARTDFMGLWALFTGQAL